MYQIFYDFFQELSSSKPNDKEVLRQKLSKKLHGWKEVLLDEIIHSGVASNLLDILTRLVPILKSHGDKNSSTGRSANLRVALEMLHNSNSETKEDSSLGLATGETKSCEFSDQLMMPTLGSQEGAFENVRMNYSGKRVTYQSRR